jgi:hypothetical protein
MEINNLKENLNNKKNSLTENERITIKDSLIEGLNV